MIKGVILDFNGTLFFDSYYHEIAWKQTSRELRGYPMNDNEIKSIVHGNNNSAIINYLVNNISDEENKRWSLRKEELYRKICIEHSDDFKLAPGVVRFLDYLKMNCIPFTIASASIRENIAFFIESFSLNKWLDTSKIVYDDGNYPTKVEMFKEASHRIGVCLNEIMIVEDSISGLNYAYECGAKKIVAVNSDKDLSKYRDKKYIDFIISDFTEFPYSIFNDE